MTYGSTYARTALAGWSAGTIVAMLTFAPMIRHMSPAHVAWLRRQPVAYGHLA